MFPNCEETNPFSVNFASSDQLLSLLRCYRPEMPPMNLMHINYGMGHQRA